MTAEIVTLSWSADKDKNVLLYKKWRQNADSVNSLSDAKRGATTLHGKPFLRTHPRQCHFIPV